MLGFPDETPGHVRETLALAKSYDPVRSMKLIMSSSFVRKKMLGRAMPEEVRRLLAGLGRDEAA